LFKLQNQISTGQRLQLPSDDAPAALRAIALQRTIAQQAQIQTNVAANTTTLNAVSSSLNSVSDLLNNVLGIAVSDANSTTGADTLANDANYVGQQLTELVNLANAQSQGQYLFSGSMTQVQPYTYNGQYVQYNGNQGSSQTYVDLNQLFAASIP